MKFSKNNNMLICGTLENFIWIIDAYEGKELLRITKF